MRIKITADSTCDLSEELLAQWDIALMPMHILMGEDSYLDGVTIHPADVFAYVNAGGKMPKSAAANLVEYTEFFEPFAKECDAVIHISVSSKLSSCFQNAKLAAGEFENVYVVDSQNICTGQGYLVLKAAKWAADGLPPRNITMRLQSLAKRVELSFVLDRLDFMAKSGRCSGVLAFGANLLGIKPALEVIDALKYLRENAAALGIDTARITAFGDSAGAYLACCLGSKNILSAHGGTAPVARVIDLNGIVDLTGSWSYGIADGGEKKSAAAYLEFYRKAKRLSPVWQVSAGDSPVAAVHGLSDSIVEVRDSVRYCDALKTCGVEAELVLLENKEHAFILFDYNTENAEVYRILEILARFLA